MAEGEGGGSLGQSIIIKKVVKGGHGGHHGVAWKIAYADFVTAMMAFFLLLWLLNSVTQEQLEGISNYFAPVTASSSQSGLGDILGGKTITEEGAAQNSTSRDSVTVDLPPPKAGSGGDGSEEAQSDNASDEAVEEAAKRKEQEQLDQAQLELEEALAAIPQLKNLAESLLIDNTPEGLRIQLVDKEGLAMFPSGGSEMYLHTKKILELVAKIINTLPQDVSISGHTDASKFRTNNGYGNWELSAERANAARRYLEHLKVAEKRIARVVGMAATEPLLVDDPTNPRNRRLSIVMLRGTGEGNPAANPGAGDGRRKKNQPESLPGLDAIKRKQLQDQRGAPQPVPQAVPPSGQEGGALPRLQLQIQTQ